MKTYDKELEFAKNLALKAGKIITDNFLHSKIKIKSNVTPVTETDFAVSQMVIEEVKKSFPDHKVLDEEKQNKDVDSEYLWICDPIDGTVPFSHQIPTSMFSIALCRNQEPVVAVIYDPFMKRLLYTWENEPSYLNGEKISVKKGGFEKGEYVFGIPYWDRNFDTNKYIDLIWEKDIRVTYVESIVYESMMVALGISKALIIIAASPWDRAAGKMIIENAGGRCTDENGNRLQVFGNPRFFVATNGTVHDEALNILQQCINR